mmetsp:Transcript_10726/g.28127  ORF Transcript_10726/g.28127 Transcript_10726/m.28127 type:complete len:258 (-) Transcript_10726:654-1427(-)
MEDVPAAAPSPSLPICCDRSLDKVSLSTSISSFCTVRWRESERFSSINVWHSTRVRSYAACWSLARSWVLLNDLKLDSISAHTFRNSIISLSRLSISSVHSVADITMMSASPSPFFATDCHTSFGIFSDPLTLRCLPSTFALSDSSMEGGVPTTTSSPPSNNVPFPPPFFFRPMLASFCLNFLNEDCARDMDASDPSADTVSDISSPSLSFFEKVFLIDAPNFLLPSTVLNSAASNLRLVFSTKLLNRSFIVPLLRI